MAAGAVKATAGEGSSGDQLQQLADAASAKAADTGERVEVTRLRTETAETYANLDGSFTTEQYALPQRVRKGGKLVDIDTSLARNANGSYSAKATEVEVTFSGGGDGPLATVTRDGRSMSWSWPEPLPAPEADGDSVVYRDVLDDVDLKLKAGTAGFGQLLIVHNAEAAANPALAEIRMPLSTSGLSVDADEHGNLRAVNPAGQEVFTAPTPQMWDSTQPPAMFRSASATPPPAMFRSASATPPPAHEFEAPYGAQEAPVGVEITDGELALTPDAEVLAGPDTQYPVYIDPAVSGSREAWAIAYSSSPSTAYYNGNGWDEGDGNTTTKYARVGNPGDGTSRSFFRMDTNNLWNTSKVISSSIFRIQNSYSYSCTHKQVETWLTGAISSSTTWSKQPSWSTKLDTVNDAKGWSSDCPAGNLSFDVTSSAKQAASSKWANITLGLRATTEGDNLSYKRFDAGTAVLSTTYNTVPNAPTSLDTIPSTGCVTASPYPTIGNTDVYLTAKVSDADGGTVKAQFRLWGNNSYAGGAEIFNQIVSVTSGTVAKVKVPKATLQAALAAAGGIFGWKAQTLDATAASTWVPASGTCRFNFDPTRPSSPPAITSTEFPDGTDGWPEATGEARNPGVFKFTNGGITDVTSYEYWTDWDHTVRPATPATSNDPTDLAEVQLTPPSAGSMRVYVNSIDGAGNRSDRASYLFYANSPATPDKAGDLNGDNNADIYGIHGEGELWLYPGQGNGNLGTYTVVSNTNFNGASITHRGDWTNDGFEDLVASIPGEAGAKTLHVFPNNGVGWACTAIDEQADGHSQSCLYDMQELNTYDPANNHWSDADQILAIGDVDGPLDTDGDGTTDVPGFPDLLVKQGDLLWLYYGADTFYLDEFRAPVLVGNGAWSNYDLAAPGDRNGNGQVDLLARHKTNGELRLYQGTGPNGEGLGNGTASTVIGTGWTNTFRPLYTAVPDGGTDGKADIWATGSDTKLYLYSNLTGSGVTIGTGGWQNFQTIN
ncbi:FG-GAP-like repeat-containing protein [Streptomyces sp. NPDC007861]|uniref:FG-GAP-like repeat-containing protein n=1 Tax=Streptomyces sp. NPDC007861 TaxID=3154893 RepID=UPI0034037599